MPSRKKKRPAKPLFDLELYTRVQTQEEGLDWDDLTAQDLRVDDFHIVPLIDGSVFKDPVVPNGLVQMKLDYLMWYAFRMILGDKKTDFKPYKIPIAKMVHWIYRESE